MWSKLSKIKAESQELCREISADMRDQAATLNRTADGLRYKSPEDFKREFFNKNNGPIVM